MIMGDDLSMAVPLQRWFSRPSWPANWGPVRDWCAAQGLTLKPTADRLGFGIDCLRTPRPIRLEWGPSRRAYLGSPTELRILAPVSLEPQSHLALMPRLLLETLTEEAAVAADTGQEAPNISRERPEELRWLILSPRLRPVQLGALRVEFGAVANEPEWVADWLRGATGDALLQWAAAHRKTAPSRPLPRTVLLLRRRRLLWRQALIEPDPRDFDAAMRVFCVALNELQARNKVDAAQVD